MPIVGTTMKEILDATAVACNTPCHVVELRIDYYERAHSIDAIIELLMLIKPQLKGRGLLFTWRTKGEGGERTISTQDYFTMLERLIPTGLVDAIDIELFFDQDRMLKTIEFAKVHGTIKGTRRTTRYFDALHIIHALTKPAHSISSCFRQLSRNTSSINKN